MNSYHAVKLITGFKDFCASKGNESIAHTLNGVADWNACAVGAFGEFKKVKKGVWGRGETMADKLREAFKLIDSITYWDLATPDLANEFFPTYDKLTARLERDIKQYNAMKLAGKL